MAEPFKGDIKVLYDGCLKGDKRCQKRLFDKFFGLFLGICFRYAVNEDEAHEMVQEGFIKIFKKMKSYNGNGSFEGWMRRIMVNNAIDFYRRKDRKTFLMDAENNVEPYEDPEEVTFSEEVLDIVGRERIMEEINKLSPAYKVIFNMYVIEGFTHKEIAEKLNIAEGTSKSNLAKAKANLRKQINEILKHNNA